MRILTTGSTGRPSRRRTTLVQGSALAVLATSLVVLAVKFDGSPIHDVELNDASVWVTNGNRGMMGRLNSQVEELDLSLTTTNTSRAVFQQGSSVQVYDDGGGPSGSRSVMFVDPVAGTGVPVPLPAAHQASSGGGTVAIVDQGTGRVWLRRADSFKNFDPSSPAALEVSPRSSVVVTPRGTALVADRAEGTVTEWRFDETGAPSAGESYDFEEGFLDDAQLSAVGETPVVLQGGNVLRPGTAPVPLDGENAVLQQVGPTSDSVYASTTTGLWRVDLGGAETDRVNDFDVDGDPAAPVNVAGCVHGAWKDAEGSNYLRTCDGQVTSGEVSGLADSADLVFRSNRDVVVLNDQANGTSWLVQEPGLTRVDNWDAVDPTASDPQVAKADDRTSDSKRNQPPTATPDTFGARPGATVVLPVTLNDVDPDGDVLVLTGPPERQKGATFSVVGEGTQVQAKIPADAKGSIDFKYEITDGQPGNPPSETTVSLDIVGAGQDTAPKLLKDQKNQLTVAKGHQASVNVLGAWQDPEGDAPVLVGATSEGGTVGYRADGTIDFTDDGEGNGEEVVEFTVRGGGATATGELAVSVVAPDKAEPVAVADHFTGTVGSRILLDPLKNDIDPLGGQLALTTLRRDSKAPAVINRDGARGVGTFVATQPGAYYLKYEATSSNGVSSSEQMIRVDVAPATNGNRTPIATRDVAAVRVGRSVLVDVLANDSDPDDDVLVVQGVEVPAKFADVVKASLINKRFVRIELSQEPDSGDEPVISYLLSDGRSDQVTGAVAVSLADIGSNRPPKTAEDQVTARAGTVIDIPVLENDKDPDGDRMTVGQQDLIDLGPDKVISGRKVPIVATGNSIRVLVPDDGTTQLQFGYGVRDAGQARSSSRVVLDIQPDDPKINQKPQPRPIQDRTVTGQKIKVDVDTFGADPDGDPVVFTGVLEQPELGRITASGTDWFEYEPLEGTGRTGTDDFKVQVSDRYGLRGVADVRIGVAAPAETNQAPSALNDDLLVKPGLTLQYPVLDNDSDPDGDSLTMAEGDLVTQKGTTARLAGDGFIEVKAPALPAKKKQAVQVMQYSVHDGLGASSTAQFSVTTRADAPDYAPTTRDDTVTMEQMRGKAVGDPVEVDVLANDGDVDGPRSALTLDAVDSQQATVVGRKLQVTLKAENQLVAYRVTDATDSSSFGFVFVAGTETMPPTLDVDAVPLEVVAGKTLPIDLAKVVVVRAGRKPTVGNAKQVAAVNGDATVVEPGKLEFIAPVSFHGSASVTVPVIDGVDLQDPEGLEAQITIPITVLPAGNVPPEVRDTQVTVTAGDEPVTLDLTRLAKDANPTDTLEFTVRGTTDDLSADQSKNSLAIQAGENATSGEVELKVDVSDGRAKPVTGLVRVTVIGNPEGSEEEKEPPRELMTLRELTVPDASVGEKVSVDVRDAILSDPYPEAGKTVEQADALTGAGAKASASGTTVSVTPEAPGPLMVAYRLSDGSGDPQRSVLGRIAITVAAPPGRPPAPQAVEGGPDAVQLTWSAPPDNGSPITEYLVKWQGGQQNCPSTQCLITGLDAGTSYRFTVTAVNAEGASEPSPPSEPLTPDTVPDAMVAPVVEERLTERDGQLHLTWKPASTTGSDVVRYEISSQPQASVAPPGAQATSTTVGGLKNGTGYRFRIRAVNERGEGAWSPYSAEAVPFTKPTPMPAPTLAAENDNGDQNGYLTVTWGAVVSPNDGWDPVSGYEVVLIRDGKALPAKPVPGGDVTTTSFNVENGHSYAAQVRATNRAGSSDWSATSDAAISWDRAAAPTDISTVSDCPENACGASTSSYVGRVGFTTPAKNGGYPVTKYTWRTSDGATGVVDAPTQATGARAEFNLTFTSNSANQKVTLTPMSAVPGQDNVSGTDAEGGTFKPYAKPLPPTQGCAERLYRSVRICWAGDGNGRPVKSVDYSGDASGSNLSAVTVPADEGGQQRCLQVRLSNDGGLASDPAGMCATAADKTSTMTFADEPGDPKGPCHIHCMAIIITVEGGRPSTVYNYTSNIVSTDGSPNPQGPLPATDANGRATRKVAFYNKELLGGDETCVYVAGFPDECEVSP